MIIFLTFWQGLGIAFLIRMGFISDSANYTANNKALAIQDFLICIEMPFFAIFHAYAFPWTDYNDSRLSSRMLLLYALRDVLGVKDVLQDTYHTFIGTTFRQPVYLRDPSDIWGDLDFDTAYEEYSEGDPLNQGRRTNYLNPETSLEFPEQEDAETELDYEQARLLEFGDYNFPVVHSDPRFAHPPTVRYRIEESALGFTQRLEDESREFLTRTYQERLIEKFQDTSDL